jgi:hypothetical protein
VITELKTCAININRTGVDTRDFGKNMEKIFKTLANATSQGMMTVIKHILHKPSLLIWNLSEISVK